MIEKLFLDHPRAVGENYLEHQAVSLSFAGPLFVAALAATIHAFIPGLCTKVGSSTINRLHQRIHAGHGRGAAMESEYCI